MRAENVQLKIQNFVQLRSRPSREEAVRVPAVPIDTAPIYGFELPGFCHRRRSTSNLGASFAAGAIYGFELPGYRRRRR